MDQWPLFFWSHWRHDVVSHMLRGGSRAESSLSPWWIFRKTTVTPGNWLFFLFFFVSPLDKIFIFPMCVQVAAHAHTFTSSIGQEQKRLYVSVKHSGYKKIHPSLSNRAEWLIARIFSSSRGPLYDSQKEK